MTHLLQRAFEKASKLPAFEQNALAKMVLSELESQARWEKVFAESEPALTTLAAEALDEHRRGKTRRLRTRRS